MEVIKGSYCLARDNKVFANNALGKFTYIEGAERAFKPDSVNDLLLYGLLNIRAMNGIQRL